MSIFAFVIVFCKHFVSLVIGSINSEFYSQNKITKIYVSFNYNQKMSLILLYAKLAENCITVDEFCTDNWKAFAKILPKKKHKMVGTPSQKVHKSY
jgi:hypothetical protein